MDEIKVQDGFLDLNIQLLKILRKALNNAKKEYDTDQVEPWQRLSIWRYDVLPNLEGLIREYRKDTFTLAKFQVGLAKYFDFFYLEWAEEEKEHIEKKVEEIVEQAFLIIKARSILNPPFIQQCTPPHEDGACIMMPLGKRCKTQRPLHASGWHDIPISAARSFLDDPSPSTLEHGAFIYRVVGNNPCGCWWFTGYFPNDITEWREKLAILKKWNLGDYYIDLQVVSAGIKVWSGKAASQQATVNCILEGGGDQVWIISLPTSS